LEKCIHGRIRNTHKEKIALSLEGFVCAHHRFVMELLSAKLAILERHSSACMEKMEALVQENYQKERLAIISNS
jgi:hypothetical protein